MRLARWLGSGLIGAGVIVGCGDESGPSLAPVASVTLNVTADTIVRGSALQLEATLRDAAGNTLEGRSLAWSTSDGLRATVSATGEVLAVELGVATITATSEGRSASAAITLSANVTVTRRLPTTFVGDTTLLRAAFSDADGGAIDGVPDTWLSSDESVATVDANGIVTGVSAGLATITATRSGGLGSVELVVLAPRIRANRELAYVQSLTETLFRVRSDGTEDTPLTDPADWVTVWAWSPEGDRIAVSYFEVFPGVRKGLYTMNADGTDTLPLVPDAGQRLWWSPDGNRILLTRGNPIELWRVDADGGNLTRLSALNIGPFGEAAWSPDGRRISLNHNSCTQFLIMDADGTNQAPVIAPTTHACSHTWSPDGKLIAFAAGQEPSGIWLMNTESMDPIPLTPNCTPQGECTGTRSYVGPRWSPDGRRLAYMSFEINGSTFRVHVFDLDRQETTEFEAGGFVNLSVDWSPDGTRLAYSGIKTEPPGLPAVVLSGIDGSGQVAITGDQDSQWPRWRP